MEKKKGRMARWVVLLFGFCLSIILLTPILVNSFLSYRSGDTIEQIEKIIIYMGTFLLFILIWYFKQSTVDRKPQAAFFRDRSIFYLLGSMLIGLFCVALFCLIVDPWDLYGIDIFPSRVNPSRNEKLDYYDELTEVPDVLITGSSSALLLSPEYIENELSLTAFNWAIHNGEPLEFAVLLEYLNESKHELPEVILVQVKATKTNTPYSQVPLEILPYIDFLPLLRETANRISDLLSTQQLAESIYVFRRVAIHQDTFLYEPEFSADGARIDVDLEFSENAVLRFQEQVPTCTSLHSNFIHGIEAVIEQANLNDSSVIFYISPYYPEAYNEYMADNRKFQLCSQLTVDFLGGLAEENENIFFKDYTLVKDMGGLEGKDGFKDVTHITAANAEKLIDALAETIQEAYLVAQEMRNENGGIK